MPLTENSPSFGLFRNLRSDTSHRRSFFQTSLCRPSGWRGSKGGGVVRWWVGPLHLHPGGPSLRRFPPSSWSRGRGAGRHFSRSDRKESSTAGSASIRSPSSMSRASGSILSGSSREKGSISKPGTWDRALAISLDRPGGESPAGTEEGWTC